MLKVLSLKIFLILKEVIKTLKKMAFKRFFNKFGRICNVNYFLVPEPMSPVLVRSKVCIATIHVRSKVCQFAPHMDESKADLVPHMKGSHADFAPYMKWRHSFRDQKIAKIENLANLQKIFCQTNYI